MTGMVEIEGSRRSRVAEDSSKVRWWLARALGDELHVTVLLWSGPL